MKNKQFEEIISKFDEEIKKFNEELDIIKKLQDKNEEFFNTFTDKNAFLVNQKKNLERITPFLNWFGWLITLQSFLFFLIGIEWKYKIFNFTKELWQMMFFLGIFILTATYMLMQIKCSLILFEQNSLYNKHKDICKLIEDKFKKTKEMHDILQKRRDKLMDLAKRKIK